MPKWEDVGNRHIILFDGVCNLCDGFVNFVFGRDPQHRFSFCPLQSPYGQKLLMKYDLPPMLSTIVYVDEEMDACYTHSGAVLRICGFLSRPYSMLWAFLIVPAIVRDTCYKMVAANRYLIWGKKEDGEACGYNPGLRKMFLDFSPDQVEGMDGMKEV